MGAALGKLITRFKVLSCADGTMRVIPTWRRKVRNSALPPGLLTRMHVAAEIERLLNGKG